MGEVVVSSEEWIMDLEEEDRQKEERHKEKEGKSNDGKQGSIIRWERFLPRMVLRVLLVEADDSTRQIVSALLRKCSYKVAAVSDGLRAWEVLKGRPHNIDLILAEVDLPSISGYALLTLIMEHEICKNIPVIMMSSHDSVSTVYKCMLRGAADFLMKPIRINELKNLWQHVWRRQSSMINGLRPQDESIAQQKVEATAENNAAAASDHSSGSKAFPRKQEDCLKKGSDAQSSCAKPDLEAESATAEEDARDVLRSNQNKSLASNTKAQEFHDTDLSQNLNSHKHINSGPDFSCFKISNRGSHVEMHNHRKAANNIHSEACEKTNLHANSSREVIDLIGTFNEQSNCSYGGLALSNGGKMSESAELNLSLTRFPLGGSESNTSISPKHTLVQSNASAFSRYVNKQLQPSSQSIASAFTPRETQINSVDHSSNHIIMVNKAGVTFPCGQQRLYPIPVPVRGVDSMQKLNPDRSFNLERAYGSIQINHSNKPERKKLDCLADRTNASSATDQSGSGSLCNGGIIASHLNLWGSSVSGSHVNDNASMSASVRNPAAEIGNEENMSSREMNSQRSIHREAALTKFRLKRKERCFEKKVRYESRKKLAEQRPRVKGQFVRQLLTEPPSPAKPEDPFGNSVGG